MTYNIIYNNEIIDTTNNITDARYFQKEYELAFHETITIQEVK